MIAKAITTIAARLLQIGLPLAILYSVFHLGSLAVDAQTAQARQQIAMAQAAQGYATGDKAAQARFDALAKQTARQQK